MRFSKILQALNTVRDLDLPLPHLDYIKESPKSGAVQYHVALDWAHFSPGPTDDPLYNELAGNHNKSFDTLSEAEKYGNGIITGIRMAYEVLGLGSSKVGCCPYYRKFTETEEEEIRDRLKGDCNF